MTNQNWLLVLKPIGCASGSVPSAFCRCSGSAALRIRCEARALSAPLQVVILPMMGSHDRAAVLGEIIPDARGRAVFEAALPYRDMAGICLVEAPSGPVREPRPVLAGFAAQAPFNWRYTLSTAFLPRTAAAEGAAPVSLAADAPARPVFAMDDRRREVPAPDGGAAQERTPILPIPPSPVGEEGPIILPAPPGTDAIIEEEPASTEPPLIVSDEETSMPGNEAGQRAAVETGPAANDEDAARRGEENRENTGASPAPQRVQWYTPPPEQNAMIGAQEPAENAPPEYGIITTRAAAQEAMSHLMQAYPEVKPFPSIVNTSRWVQINCHGRQWGNHYLAGIVYQNNTPQYFCWAVPGQYRMTPPPGLEDHRFLSTNSQNNQGYWALFQRLTE